MLDTAKAIFTVVFCIQITVWYVVFFNVFSLAINREDLLHAYPLMAFRLVQRYYGISLICLRRDVRILHTTS